MLQTRKLRPDLSARIFFRIIFNPEGGVCRKGVIDEHNVQSCVVGRAGRGSVDCVGWSRGQECQLINFDKIAVERSHEEKADRHIIDSNPNIDWGVSRIVSAATNRK